MNPQKLLAVLSIGLLSSAIANAANNKPSVASLTVWDLKIGDHARQLPKNEFMDFACGTNGGPPSIPIADWTQYSKCPGETGTKYHEVYFRYDDEAEYVARARFADTQAVDVYTSAYDVPIVVSALFDDDGFMVGYRIVNDQRVELSLRDVGANLAGPLKARYGEAKFVCVNLPRQEGETEYQGIFLKRQCRQAGAPGGLDLFLESHLFRKRGQTSVNPVTGPTQGEFESTTYFQATLSGEIPDRARRLAALPEPRPSEKDILIKRAHDCPGCDLRGVDLKRADLTGANLAGADLTGATLHGATLTDANLSGANLTGANVNRANARRAIFQAAILAGAMLYQGRFDGADLSRANLSRAFAGRVQLIRTNLSDANLSGVDLSNGRLSEVNLRAADLSGSNLNDVQLTRSVLAGAKLIDASLWRASLVGADLSRVDARGADLFGANLRDTDLTAADFSNSRMTSANLTSAKTDGAKFDGALLPAGFVPAR